MGRIWICILKIYAIVLLFLSQNAVAQDQLFDKVIAFQTMSQRWELDSIHKKGTFRMTPYKPIYVTIVRWESNPNKQPFSENTNYNQPVPINYSPFEAKLDISLKTKVAQGLFWGYGDVWVGYTQKALWQAYNKALSRPFRELNYEPEVILNVAMKIDIFIAKLRMAGVSLNHQSNGMTVPLSRSWNRVIFFAGFERNTWQVYLRRWIRLPDSDDENPAITDYYGRGEIIVIKNLKRHQLALIATNSLRFDITNRGSLKATWSFPVYRNLRMQFHAGYGYGETLVDYNHKQGTLGICVSLIDW